jgi:acyl-CoA dehydrogenase
LATGASEYLQDPSTRLLVEFFRNKGLESLKQEDGREDWYQDWIEFQAQHGLYASLLSPRKYSSRGHRFDRRKLTRFVEVFAYFSPAHAYSLHVSFLGLSVILMSDNEPLKQEAIARLEAGELFALAISEQVHGADLFANEFAIHEGEGGGFLADGEKYYIGNANVAGLMSILARTVEADGAGPTRRSDFVFFALRPGEAPGFQNVQKIRTLGVRSAFVGEFEVRSHPVAEGDVISQGRGAWDAVFATVNLGKFILGFGAVGSCSHAFAEALDHMHHRVLYNRRVTEIPHLRVATALAFARLSAMKLYANRALDYLQGSCADDRRYLLFTAVQKARVSTEGVKVMTLLSECVGAWGFETETFFETALRDMQLIPALESSTHINFELTARFIGPYFAAGDTISRPPVPPTARDVGENLYWMEARFRNFRTVRFAHCLDAYEPLRTVPNAGVFMKQTQAFSRFVQVGVTSLRPTTDAGLHVRLGRCLSVIAYAQLVAENCVAIQAPLPLVSVIFHSLIEDLGEEALRLAALFPAESLPRTQLKSVVRVPRTDACDFESVSDFVSDHYSLHAPASKNTTQ